MKIKKDRLTELYELKCPFCGKRVISLNENQVNYNMRQHEMSCAAKKKKIKEQENLK